jgi:hypothetical protein
MTQLVVVLVTTDLLAVGRVEGAARAAGWDVEVVSPGRPYAGIGRAPDLVVVDLEAVGKDKLGDLAFGARTIGFYSHVDEELGRVAAAAGIEALPRGRFWRELPGLLTPPAGS